MERKIKRREILGFFGDDKKAAWAEAFRLAETLEESGATWCMGVEARYHRLPRRRPEWVIMLVHYDLGH